ncbi:hypothetical protein N7520_010557 [Penicillium odoratum]|uniref:uncharacterized protein n=1 Tax=Penicillium odoratum TaxID=1167516 RepID=UPI002546A5C6|nr:uncharacterized protein N7520_010557 [Penicillium odoratum]KAJ5745375.1 hypothetical protein N7520_010557 [Penicillium odoratum]
MRQGQKDTGIVILLSDSAHSTLPYQGQGSCMAIESGIALAAVMRHWKNDDLEGAFRYEAGKLASSDSPNEMTEKLNSEALGERMKLIMKHNVLEDLKIKGAELLNFHDSRL